MLSRNYKKILTDLVLDNDLILDKEFLKRQYLVGDFERFNKRLSQIGFCGGLNFLDFGSGFGQWSIAASELNSKVFSVELDSRRSGFIKELTKQLEIENLRVENNLDFALKENIFFDFIFLYSVIPYCDYRILIPKLIHLLKPGGRLYLNANDIGYIIQNLLEPIPGSEFDRKMCGLRCLKNTIIYSEGSTNSLEIDWKDGLWVSANEIKSLVNKSGGIVVHSGGEGTFRVENCLEVLDPFFQSEYKGITAVFEVVIQK